MCCSTVHSNVLQLRGKRTRVTLNVFFFLLSLTRCFPIRFSHSAFELCMFFFSFRFSPRWPHVLCNQSNLCHRLNLNCFFHSNPSHEKFRAHECVLCSCDLHHVGISFADLHIMSKKKSSGLEYLSLGNPDRTLPNVFAFTTCIFF